MTHSIAQYTLQGGRYRTGRTIEIYMMLMSKALAAIDDGLDEHVVLLVRPESVVRITFKKQPPPPPTQYIFDDVPGVLHDPQT